jgi:hypothetical protein
MKMMYRKTNKDSDTKKVTSARQVTTSRSHIRRDEHGNDRKSRSLSRNHHSLGKYNKRYHTSLGPRSIPSVSLFRKQRRFEGYVLQGELGKIKPPTFNYEHRKGEEVEVWMLEMNKYF